MGPPKGAGAIFGFKNRGIDKYRIVNGNGTDNGNANGNENVNDNGTTPASCESLASGSVLVSTNAATGVTTALTDSCDELAIYDKGSGTKQVAISSNAGTILSKFDSDGSFHWARAWSSIWTADVFCAPSAGEGLANVYMAGSFNTTVDFDPGPEVDEHEPPGLDSNNDAYLMKILPNGFWEYV